VVPILVLLLRKRRDNTKNLTQIKYKGRRVDFFYNVQWRRLLMVVRY